MWGPTLNNCPSFKKTTFFFTAPGADLENNEIMNEVGKYIKYNENAYFFKSLGHINYFSFLNFVDGMIGNSSSGILEMPYFKKGTVNIGNRQTGRLCAKSVVNTKIDKLKIQEAIKKIISNNFLKNIKTFKNNMHGKPGATDKIIKILKRIDYKNVYKSNFFDIKPRDKTWKLL